MKKLWFILAAICMVAFVACDEGDDKLSDGTVGGSVTEGGSGDDESDEGGIGVPTTSLIGRWECYRIEWRFDDGILHTEDSPFAIWGSPRVEGSAPDNNTDKGNEGGDKGNEGDDLQPGGSGTRSSYDENSDDEDDMVIVGYNTRIYEFRADGICHFEGLHTYLSDDEEDELLTEDVHYKFEGETLVLTDGTFTKEHTVELSKDRLVLKYTSETTTEEMPWREMTEYFRRIE